MGREFGPMLAAQHARGHYSCLGLDSDYDALPPVLRGKGGSVEAAIEDFNCANIDATADVVCAFKFDIAFYQKHGDAALRALRNSVAYIRKSAARETVIIGDAKYYGSEIANPAYAQAAFDWFGFDAVTICHRAGRDANRAFLDRKDKGIFVVCHMSHKGTEEFQDDIVMQKISYASGSMYRYVPEYQNIAEHVASWNKNGNCGIVMGATYPEQLKVARRAVGDMPILLTGFNTQGGSVEVVKHGVNSKRQGIIANIGRSAAFADRSCQFAERTRWKMMSFNEEIDQHR